MPTTTTTLTLDELPIAMALLDSRQRVVEANPALEGLLGLEATCVGRRLRQVLDDAGAVMQDDPAGKLFRLGRGPEGRAFRLFLHARGEGALAVLQEAVAPSAGMGHLLTDEVREQLMHDAEIGTWRYDPDIETYYFPTELSLGHGGISRPVPLGVLQQLQHPNDRAIDTGIRDRITREGGAAEAEIRYLSADGGWTHLRVLYRAGPRLPSGRYEMLGISQSITSLAKARDEANAAAQRLSLALMASRAGVFEYDFKEEAFWFSPEFRALVGEETLARLEGPAVNLFHPDDREELLSLRERTIDEPIDARLQRLDGECWVKVYLQVDRKPDGSPRRGVGLMIDIDEAKRQELAVGEARRVAEEATASKSDFLASVSHEIRTPMNGIVGVLNLLRGEQLSPDGAQLLEEALGCAGMLSQLINDVLDFSKIEAGKLNMTPEPADIAVIVEGVTRLLRPQAEAKGLCLNVELGGDLGWGEIDAVRLRQCLFNVVGNAVKFTEAGGVTVRAVGLGAGAGRRLRFEVEDTGIGVPESARSRLFDRFQQVDGGATRRFGGTGLGLAISRQLARMMGGELDYDSREGVGSTFWFEIAAPEALAPGARSDDEAQAAPLAGLRILVVDDNRVNRLVGVKSVEALGASAEAVESGAKAIEAVRDGDFDLVLMDINMPGMDGLEATRRIRALGGAAAEVPILALTADVMRQQKQAYLAAGMNGMAPKPFSPAQLLAEIAALAGEDAGERAAR